jgi:hypothetical protein
MVSSAPRLVIARRELKNLELGNVAAGIKINTTYDHALTKPWTVSPVLPARTQPDLPEYPCTEDNRWVTIGGELYLADGAGYLMSIQKGQSAPYPKDLQIQPEICL